MYRQCIACYHLYLRLKYFWTDTQGISNHGYLFWGTEVGGKWVTEVQRWEEDNSIVFSTY